MNEVISLSKRSLRDQVKYWTMEYSALYVEKVSLQAEVERLKAESEWVSVSERLPKTLERVEVRFRVNNKGDIKITLAEYIAPRSVLSEDYLDPDCAMDFTDYDEEKDVYWTPAGFYEFQYMADMNWFIDDAVIDWRPMPLPAAPRSEK